jgi:predicted RNase H-related nuclease YkuK (DUF458 family)
MKWRTLNEEPIPDIKEWMAEVSKDKKPVHIGTDSMQTGRYTQFVTVVAVLTPGKGGRAAYSRFVVPRIKSLRERLLREVWESVSLGLDLTGIVAGEMSVHIDANPVLKHRSSKYIQELVGMVVSNGFNAKIKPDAWASSHAADHIVRTHGKFPRAA